MLIFWIDIALDDFIGLDFGFDGREPQKAKSFGQNKKH